METKRVLLMLSFAIVLSISLGDEEFANQSHDWKYFVFSQWWPQSQCYYKENADSLADQSFRIVNDYRFRNDCVPTYVENWTIHGLWPTLNGTPNPGWCNDSWKFNESKIEDLKSQMMSQWIALPDSSESEQLWKHEWEKHGTCAASLPAVSNEHAYFLQALKLNRHTNLLKMLADKGISPSDDNTYKVEEFEDAIMKEYGVKGRVICVKEWGDDQYMYIGGIRICFNKTFSPIDCLVTEPEKCRKGEDLKYPVIIHA